MQHQRIDELSKQPIFAQPKQKDIYTKSGKNNCKTGIPWLQQRRCCNSNSNNCKCKSTTLNWCVAFVQLILKLPLKVYPSLIQINWWIKSKIIFTYRYGENKSFFFSHFELILKIFNNSWVFESIKNSEFCKSIRSFMSRMISNGISDFHNEHFVQNKNSIFCTFDEIVGKCYYSNRKIAKIV